MFHSVMVAIMVAVGARGLKRKRDAAEGCCTKVPVGTVHEMVARVLGP